jgi:hypothetical protein
MASVSKAQSTIDVFERGLIGGHARWIADLNEFFRNHPIRGTTFDLYARGRTRNKGFFISRFFAWTVLPDYNVSLLCVDANRLGSLTSEKLRELMDDALYLVKQQELQWLWLIVLLNKELPAWAVSFVSRYDRKELGLALGSTFSGQVAVSRNQIGQSIGKQLGFKRLMEKVANEQAN